MRAAGQLKYRDFLTVCLIVDQAELFADNWIYIHEPEVKVGRIQNFKNWSPAMLPDQSKTSLGLEYFCNEGDELWCTSDADLIELGKRELEQIGLVAVPASSRTDASSESPSPTRSTTADYRECLATIKTIHQTAWRTSRPSAAMACTGTTTRTTPCSPGSSRRATWSWARRMTSGTSTSTRSTTKRSASPATVPARDDATHRRSLSEAIASPRRSSPPVHDRHSREGSVWFSPDPFAGPPAASESEFQPFPAVAGGDATTSTGQHASPGSRLAAGDVRSWPDPTPRIEL